MALAVVRFDLRRSPSSDVPVPELYSTALDMAAYADEQGYDMLVLSEHHGDPGGYLPSPLVMAGAMAGRTSRMPILFSALLVPMHDPIRLAEDIAVLDLVSGGRIWIVTGLGYRPSEYHLMSREWKRRGKLLDESLEVMLQAWTGEPFEYKGETVVVRPTPVQQPHPMLFVGGSAEATAQRAARFGLGLFPSDDKPELADVYAAECEKLGKTPGMVMMPKGPAAVVVSSDPEAAWAEIGHLMLEDAEEYASHLTDDMSSLQASGAQTVDDLRDEGVYRILTPEECLDLNEELGPFGGITLHPLVGGTSPEIGWESLHLFTEQVLPKIKA
jgi:alkanesulfonate monooxygenase SsuD/methylene tetrahydromethanopterin reductase-like flavin-dependent oxidoreductase (luciferase family)